ncbi:tRNA pseudouridine synthase B [Lachnospiraceae bacterium]|nr:tRNA pseudouridine synthase B [Lachnospiraceae bacterium]
MYHGIINVYKEAGFTSHDVVAKLRGICKQKKIGHTGTLDPDAVGVLPVCLGNGTRLCDMLTDRSKEYIACLRLGIVTDTQDISGKILEEKAVGASPEEVARAAEGFVGEILQTPPMYSALKVNGKKLCDLARKGQEVARAARPVTIFSLEIQKEEHPEYTIKVACSKGTYIRTLCHDIGQVLGCGGVMKSLTRTRVGEFTIENALALKELQRLSDENALTGAVVPVEHMFRQFPVVKVKESALRLLKNGNPLRVEDIVPVTGGFSQGQQFRVYGQEGIFYGVYCYQAGQGLLCPVKMFLPEA